MNGRTCQLCGRSLSRFTVGSGGDFCSREHRNQFRLRLGMDRLLEANKVASLMRRRENAKAIPAAQLALDSKILPRTAPHLRLPVRQPDIRSLGPRPAALETNCIVPNSGDLLPPRQTAAQWPSTVRPLDPVDPFTGHPGKPLLLPFNTDTFPARIVQAGARAPRLAGPRPVEHRRDVAELKLDLHRTRLGGNGIQVLPVRSTPENCQEPQPPRRLNNIAERGWDLRVSGGIGFRLPAARIRTINFTGPRTRPLGPSTALRGMAAAAQPKKTSGAPPAVIRMTLRGLFGPIPPKPDNVIEFRWPDAIANAAGRPRQATAAKRTCDVEWIVPPPVPPQLRNENSVVRLRPRVAPLPSISAPEPRGIESAPRLTLVDFEPRETPFECTSALHGSLVSEMHFGTAPVRKAEPEPLAASLEEHFDGGLQNWTGGTSDWKVDVAGVRAGSLALYTPSLPMRDYVLEFLTRIEARGVTWVFRAAGLNDYYRATLAAAAGGGYEFRRCAVIGGAAETPVVRTVPAVSSMTSGKTAVTLRTRVAGNEFNVFVDGQAIETWTDSRLAAGGIGFQGAPAEGARLYWVKVMPARNLGKEQSKP